MKDKIVVFGGSGFLGSHVCDELITSGYEVTIFDYQESNYKPHEAKFIKGDILNYDDVYEAIVNSKYVFNFAGLADIDQAKNHPIETVKLNVLGNVNILEACKECKVERFIFASTVYVYSSSGSFYRASKQSAEKYIETYHERYGLNYTIMRYGSLYGRRADERNAIYRFIKQALDQNKIVYNGNPDGLREYIHVKDASRLSVKILEKNYENKHFILTGTEKMTFRNLLNMISEILNNNVNIVFKNDSNLKSHYTMTPYSYSPSIGEKLVSNQFIDMGQGILDCISEYKQN